MSLGLVGRKIGMTRIFTDDGDAVPVTVLDVANNRVTQIKTPETDGYAAVQVTYGKRRASRVVKPQAGHLAKAGVEAGELLREFPVEATELANLKVGETISIETFAVGQLVDVSGTTKGRGFSGVIRRHHFSSNRASHGNSRSHNTPGSISMAQDPGRVFPGKRMAGQYGNVKRTVQTLKVVRIDAERGLLLVKGAVPGADGGHIVVRPSVKTPLKKGA
jgi:large subunit ribosomal protein L3